MHHTQKIAGHPQIRGETALSRLQQRVSQGDVKSLVVQPEEQKSGPVNYDSPVLARLAQQAQQAQQQSEGASPAKMRWKNLKHQTASHIGDAARAVRDELTNTSSTSVIDMGTGGDGDGQGDGTAASVVSTTGQPTRSTRRPRRVPNGMGPQLVRRKYK